MFLRASMLGRYWRSSTCMAGSLLILLFLDGNEQSNSAKKRDFLDLVVVNSKSNSLRIMIHFEYLPPSS